MFDVQFTVKDIEEKATMRGKMEAAIEIAKKLLKKGLSVKDISETTGLDEGLIEQLEDDYNQGVIQPV